MARIRRFLHDIHRRSIWQAAGIYVVGAWVALTVVDTLAGALGLPDWAPRLALFLMIVGLPVVVATAFIQSSGSRAPMARDESGAESPLEVPVAEGVAEPAPVYEADRARSGASLRSRFTWRNTAFGGVAALALWGLVATALVITRRDATGGDPGRVQFASTFPELSREYREGIAVKLFRNFSFDSTYDHLAAGITDELIHELNHVEGLRVTSFTTAVALAESPITPPQIAQQLQVEHLIEGSVQPYRDSVRILVQVIEAAADDHEMSLEFTRDTANVLALREEVAHTVIDSLLIHLPELARGAEEDHREHSPAHEPWLRGKQALGRRTTAGIREAIDAFRAALALDDEYAPAYAGLSSAYALSITYRTQLPMNAYSAAGLAVRLAGRAIELQPDLAAGYVARGFVSSIAFAPTDLVLADFEQAIRLEPEAPEVSGWYATLLAREGQLDEALAQSRRSVSLSPLAPGRRIGLAFAALEVRDYAGAAEAAAEAGRLSPDLMLARALEARARLLLGEPEHCLQINLGPYAATRAMCLHTAGLEEEATAMVDSLRQVLETRSHDDLDFTEVLPSEDLAIYYAWIGETDLAIEWLDRTFAESPSGVERATVQSGLFDQVLGDPEFQSELARLRNRAWTRVERNAAATDELTP